MQVTKSRAEYMRVWRAKNPDKLRVYWSKRDKDQKAQYWKSYYAENKESITERNKKYAPQRALYKKAWVLKKKEENAGSKKTAECEICGKAGKIVYDHNHQTGAFRGWICGKCNVAIGMVDEDIEILNKIKKYLETRN